MKPKYGKYKIRFCGKGYTVTLKKRGREGGYFDTAKNVIKVVSETEQIHILVHELIECCLQENTLRYYNHDSVQMPRFFFNHEDLVVVGKEIGGAIEQIYCDGGQKGA